MRVILIRLSTDYNGQYKLFHCICVKMAARLVRFDQYVNVKRGFIKNLIYMKRIKNRIKNTIKTNQIWAMLAIGIF